jgi:hypothetical protein
METSGERSGKHDPGEYRPSRADGDSPRARYAGMEFSRKPLPGRLTVVSRQVTRSAQGRIV